MPDLQHDQAPHDQGNVNEAAFAVQDLIPHHDAIKPLVIDGIKYAVANIGDNYETANSSIARLFEKIGEFVQAMSYRVDCFLPSPPTIETVKLHHNMFVRLMSLIDSNVKTDTQPRLEGTHVTPDRRRLKLYPTRYYDIKNDYIRRWVELGLHGLSNIAQLTENGRPYDYGPETAKEMKKMYREAYRLMCFELFNVDLDEAANVFDETAPFFLTQTHFDAYNVSEIIPSIEWIKHPPIGLLKTEDEVRHITEPNIQVSPGVSQNDPNIVQRQTQRAAEQGSLLGRDDERNTGRIIT